jgi:hypothetical protein
MLGALIDEIRYLPGSRTLGRAALAALALASASCVPVSTLQAPSIGLGTSAGAPAASPMTVPVPAAPAAIAPPLAPAVASQAPLAFEGHTELDRLRSLDCLAQAIYYEAGRESEDGQRAVAQVVLNRVRHPAWPNSVCGVVYQGPMRAGGGCQFTFTCDGSLMARPAGEAWLRARRLAAEALAGYVHAPVANATHYHAYYVSPAWAPRLRPAGVIGAHLFYSLPGRWGEASAFTDHYTGVEPFPRPSFTMLRRPRAGNGLADLVGLTRTGTGQARASANAAGSATSWAAPDPAEAMVREEYRQLSPRRRKRSPIARSPTPPSCWPTPGGRSSWTPRRPGGRGGRWPGRWPAPSPRSSWYARPRRASTGSARCAGGVRRVPDRPAARPTSPSSTNTP